MHAEYQLENVKGRDQLEDHGEDWRMTLILILIAWQCVDWMYVVRIGTGG
jgi:hypothetical protein